MIMNVFIQHLQSKIQLHSTDLYLLNIFKQMYEYTENISVFVGIMTS